jgi:plastocyanin
MRSGRATRWLVALTIAAVSLGAALTASPMQAAAAARPIAPVVAPRPMARPAADYQEVKVAMRDNLFAPQTIVVSAGGTVEWHNDGRNKHNVYPDKVTSSFPKSPTIAKGKSYELKFSTPGVYNYYCSFHGAPGHGMIGTVIVKNADGTIPAAVRNSSAGAKKTGKSRTIRVPKNYKHVQQAVDAAKPGDLILISPGTYHEAVTVTTDGIVLRGLDRNKVILDGDYKLDNGVKVLEANGVAVENLTARGFTQNGFYWDGVKGYRGSYLTTTRDGDYGIYAFDSTDGQFDHDYASGSPDGGFYVGQCFPCNALVTDSISEYNGLGFSGTNAGGNLVLTKSIYRRNRVGIVPNSLSSEKNPPQHDATIVGNVVYANNYNKGPAIDAAKLAEGNGIIVGGGNHNLVEHNLVYHHKLIDILVIVLPDDNGVFWASNDNRVVDNTAFDSSYADLGALGGDRNCFADNHFHTSRPANIEQVFPCTGVGTGATSVDAIDANRYINGGQADSVDYRKAPTPKVPKLKGMKHPSTAKADPATHIVVHVDIDSIPTPKKPKS